MPRTRKPAPPAPPVESRPFADESVAPFASLSSDAQAQLAADVAADKAAGLSGNDLRAKYGERLTGPARRKLLRAHGLASTATIARSYSQYRDGAPRNGSQHAREHGSLAGARRREHAEAQAASLTVPACRRLLHDAGLPVPSVRKGDATALRAAVADVLAASTVA